MIDFNTQRNVMSRPFSIAVHKNTFNNYLEIILDESGQAYYAVSSHQEWLVNYACRKFEVSHETLENMCPPEMYCEYIRWLTKVTGCIAVWDIGYTGSLNCHQKAMLELLKLNELYKGVIL
ncbi:MAG: hypothetical protein K2H28_01530 [Ruminococcus sp.]|nr:hypothetical protein [Ruminococcus sp.]